MNVRSMCWIYSMWFAKPCPSKKGDKLNNQPELSRVSNDPQMVELWSILGFTLRSTRYILHTRFAAKSIRLFLRCQSKRQHVIWCQGKRNAQHVHRYAKNIEILNLCPDKDLSFCMFPPSNHQVDPKLSWFQRPWEYGVVHGESSSGVLDAKKNSNSCGFHK